MAIYHNFQCHLKPQQRLHFWTPPSLAQYYYRTSTSQHVWFHMTLAASLCTQILYWLLVVDMLCNIELKVHLMGNCNEQYFVHFDQFKNCLAYSDFNIIFEFLIQSASGCLYYFSKYITLPGSLLLPAVAICGWCEMTIDLAPTPVGLSCFLNGPQVEKKIVKFYISRYLTSWPYMTFDLYVWPLTSWTCEDSYILSINQV